MTAANPDNPIRFEPEEACPPGVALLVGFQGAALVLAPTVLNVAIAIRASGLDDGWLSWGVFAAMLICASITAFQAIQLRRFGAGHVVLAGPPPCSSRSWWPRSRQPARPPSQAC